jgi:dolichyl-phosphate-mannose-protein mannosyltransferase
VTATAAVDSTRTTGRATRRGPSAVLLVPVALVAVAGGLRLWGLDTPERLYFDERYYAVDALDYVRRGVEDGRAVHPPLGKWLIAAGIEVFGDRPLGWRIAPALAGTLTVLLTYLLGRRLTGSVLLAGVAGLLVAVDGLAFTASRIAMLDVFLGLFTVLAVWLVLQDRRARLAAPGGWCDAVVGSRWRWAAGAVLGLAVATKWSGALAVLACGLLVLGSEAALPSSTAGERVRRALAAGGGLVLSFLVLPFAVHLASYAGWFANYEDSYAGGRACAGEQMCEHGPVERLQTWWGFQGELVRYHQDLEATHSYRSSPAGWPVLARPVLQYREGCPEREQDRDRPCVVEPGERALILGVGNPVVWWTALLAYPLLAWQALRHRRPEAGAVLVVLLALWLPWFLSGKPGYLFYLVPAVPFLALAVPVALAGLRPRRAVPVVAAAVAGLAMAAFAFFYPVLTGTPLSVPALELRLWLSSWG